MKIKQLHAHFLVSIGNYSNERIGFTVDVDSKDNLFSVVSELRDKAIKIVGKDADSLYRERSQLRNDCIELENKIAKYTEEWNAMAEFLQKQGIRTDAPSMPRFSNLLTPAIEEESVTEAEFDF